MKTLLFVCAALVLAFSASTVQAADVSGTWKGSVSSPDGSSFPLTFTLKQDGAALTGTSEGPQGDAMDITDGKVDGNKITFKVAFNGMTIVHEGIVSDSGDEIKMTAKADSGEFPPMELTLKRDQASAPAPSPQL
jgi:hypothetical protein